MKILVCLSLTVFVFLAFACSKNNKAVREEVFIDDGFSIADKNEIVIDEASFKSAVSRASQSGAGSRETTRIASDGSQIMIVYDAFGNKTEKRVFEGNPLLQLVVVRTSVSGEKQISVFAQNGEVKQLPPDMLDKVLTLPVNELATAAGIYEGRKEETAQPMIVQTNQPPLQPMPSYRFPVQQPQTANVPAEETTEAETDEPVETAKPVDKTASTPKSKDENPAPKIPPVEQK